MSGVLELEPVAAPATVLKSEGMGRERWVRGFHFGDFGHRKRRSTTAAVAAIAAAPRAHRGELTGSREGEGHGLGLVGEGHEVLTAGGIEPRWTGRGDRRGGLFLGKKQRSGELE